MTGRGACAFNRAVPDPAPVPTPEDDAFALRLYDEKFIKQIRKASRPVFPEILRPDREDVIQEALAKTYEKREQFKGTTQEDLLGWVLVSLKNLTIDILRKRSREPAVDPVPGEVLDEHAAAPVSEGADPEADEEEEASELPPKAAGWVKMVKDVLAGLSAEDRDIILLRHDKHLSFPEIAELLSTGGETVTEDAAKMRYHRAVKRLMEIAEEAKRRTGGSGG